MFVMDDGITKGYSVAFFPRGRKLKVRDMAADMRYVSLRITVQILVLGLCALYRHDQTALHILSVAAFILLAARMAFGRYVLIDTSKGRWVCSLAPARLWFDHLSLYAMLFTVVFATGDQATPSGLPGPISMGCSAVVAFVGLCPIWCYFVYRHENGRNR